MKHEKKKKNRGVTLTELLIVALTAYFLMIVVFATMSSSLNAYLKTQVATTDILEMRKIMKCFQKYVGEASYAEIRVGPGGDIVPSGPLIILYDFDSNGIGSFYYNAGYAEGPRFEYRDSGGYIRKTFQLQGNFEKVSGLGSKATEVKLEVGSTDNTIREIFASCLASIDVCKYCKSDSPGGAGDGWGKGTKPNTFAILLGGATGDLGKTILQTSDGDYIGAGIRLLDIYLFKITARGDLDWSCLFGRDRLSNLMYNGQCLQIAPDNGFVVLARSTSSPGSYDPTLDLGSSAFYLVKTDPNGQPQWSKLYGGREEDSEYIIDLVNNGTTAPFSVARVSTGGYLLVGRTETFSGPGGGYASYIVKVDDAGEPEWSKDFGSAVASKTSQVYSAHETSSNELVIGGGWSSYGYFLKLANDGTYQWSRYYSNVKGFGSCPETLDYSQQSRPPNGYVVPRAAHLELNGDLDWFKPYTEYTTSPPHTKFSGFRHGIQASDGNYVFVGSCNEESTGYQIAYMVKTDPQGNEIWVRFYKPAYTNYTYLNYVQESFSPNGDPNGFIVVGELTWGGLGSADIYIIKTDHEGYCDQADNPTQILDTTPTDWNSSPNDDPVFNSTASLNDIWDTTPDPNAPWWGTSYITDLRPEEPTNGEP